MFKIWSILDKEFKTKFYFVLLLIFVGIFFEAFGVGLILPLVNIATSGVDSLPDSIKNITFITNILSSSSALFYSMIFFVTFFIFRTLILGIIEYYKQKFVYSLQENLSSRILAGYLNNEYDFFLKRNSSIFIRNIITEIGLLSNVTQSFLIIISETLVCIALFLLLAYFEPMGTFLALTIFSFGGLFFFLLIKKNVGLWGSIRHKYDAYRIKNLQQSFGSIKEIIISNKQKYFLNKFVSNTHITMEAARKQNTVQQLPRLLLELLAITGIALISFTLLAQNKDSANIAGILALFAASAFRLMPSINRILTAAQTMRYAGAVTETIHSEISNFEGLPPKKQTEQKIMKANIEFKDVSFCYAGLDEKVLNNINLKIDSNSTVAFIGSSGSGKSTLIDLVLGALKPSFGSIFINNNDLNSTLAEWQNSVGYVPQDIYLTDETLMENIAFGVQKNNIDKARVHECIKLANLENFISELPDGLETKVGERGVRISGGQLQRVGIARALYKKPSILILDEATSALDSITEKKIMKAVFGMSGDITIIIIAHRLSTIESCDYIYKLENGCIASHGKPEQILNL
jgi:ATP-binding cassette, subfamily B, bacterial PglK